MLSGTFMGEVGARGNFFSGGFEGGTEEYVLGFSSGSYVREWKWLLLFDNKFDFALRTFDGGINLYLWIYCYSL